MVYLVKNVLRSPCTGLAPHGVGALILPPPGTRTAPGAQGSVCPSCLAPQELVQLSAGEPGRRHPLEGNVQQTHMTPFFIRPEAYQPLPAGVASALVSTILTAKVNMKRTLLLQVNSHLPGAPEPGCLVYSAMSQLPKYSCWNFWKSSSVNTVPSAFFFFLVLSTGRSQALRPWFCCTIWERKSGSVDRVQGHPKALTRAPAPAELSQLYAPPAG